MKICFFADSSSIHTVRRCNYFVSKGHEVHLISFKNVSINGTVTHFVDIGNIAVAGGNWKVLLKYRKIKALLKQIQPDIFHAHYATSYGITGALCNYHPYVITTYGTDVLISGQKSLLYKMLLKFAFSRTDWVNTLAPHMSDAVRKIGANMKKVSVIPFGIDTNVFNSKNRKESSGSFIITSTRNLEEVYNLPHLIKAVAKIKDLIPDLKFNIVGTGSLQSDLEHLVENLGLNKITTFYGKVTQSKIVEILNQTNIFVTVSLSDGNALSLAEAMACGAFCIGTNIPANTQWIRNNENGFFVEINDVDTLAERILFAYTNYNELQIEAQKLNKIIIENAGVWENNMKQVEIKYESLIQNK